MDNILVTAGMWFSPGRNVSKLPSVITLQSTVTNKNSVQPTVINLIPIMPNSKIVIFPYSNIQGNLTINLYGTNDKNWTSY
jgi:hypothetical protein